jgi:hypothetical protein
MYKLTQYIARLMFRFAYNLAQTTPNLEQHEVDEYADKWVEKHYAGRE